MHQSTARSACTLLVSALLLVTTACDDEPPTRRPRPQPLAAAAVTPAGDLREIEATALFQQLKNSGRRGTVVNVWASWCGSCRGEVPLLLQMRKTFAAEGIDFVFVSADERRDYPKAAELMRSWSAPAPFLAVAGSMEAFKRAMHTNWKGAIPATFLFDAAQKLRHYWEGPVLEHEISPILQGFLAGEPIDGETRPLLTGEGNE